MNFIFTSVGDNTNFDNLWLGDDQLYDVYVIYYGDNESVYSRYKYNKHIIHIEKRKGSKFQNFIYFYNTYRNIINKYERFFILDDDIIFSIKDINSMFEISNNFKLDICGPSFTKDSKFSWKCTKHKPNTLLTYTNFVEVGVLLLNKKALINLMKFISPKLIENGIDLIAIWANGLYRKKAYAIIHRIQCKNPTDVEKGCREYRKIENNYKSIDIFVQHAKKIGCPSNFNVFGREYSNIYYKPKPIQLNEKRF